jgi:hypothetical protein
MGTGFWLGVTATGSHLAGECLGASGRAKCLGGVKLNRGHGPAPGLDSLLSGAGEGRTLWPALSPGSGWVAVLLHAKTGSRQAAPDRGAGEVQASTEGWICVSQLDAVVERGHFGSVEALFRTSYVPVFVTMSCAGTSWSRNLRLGRSSGSGG